jgi:uncharacterized membrane protein YphA (DoxX/SURF4 family)
MQATTNPPVSRTVPSSPTGGSWPRWHWATRIAFRFSFVYLILYILPFPVGQLPYTDSVGRRYNSVWEWLVPRVARHVFHLEQNITTPFGGDMPGGYIQVFCFLVLAGAATLIWSVLDGRRPAYPRMYAWLRLLVRLNLAFMLVVYGLNKVFPSQMNPPALTWLGQPLGEFYPSGLLWQFMGASPVYEMFCGWMETLAAVLLMARRTTALGALLAIVIMTNVFMLNMCYDVQVKEFSFNLLLQGIFLFAPDAIRLVKLLVLGRNVEPTQPVELFSRRWLNLGLAGLQLVFWARIFENEIYWNRQYVIDRDLAMKSSLYGIWNVEEFTVDGQDWTPKMNGLNEWRRIIFDGPRWVQIQMSDDTEPFFRVKLALGNRTLTLVVDKTTKGQFSIKLTGPDLMTLTGEWDTHQLEAKLKRTDEHKLPLTSNEFHWTWEPPPDD